MNTVKIQAVLTNLLICTSFKLEYFYAGSCESVIRFLTTSERGWYVVVTFSSFRNCVFLRYNNIHRPDLEIHIKLSGFTSSDSLFTP